MTVKTLPTRTSTQWFAAQQALRTALPVADHALLTEHARMADAFLAECGHPTLIWANRIAAIAVVAQRRADVAPTSARRIAYLDVAAAATALLALADHIHGVQPDDAAMAILAPTGSRSEALV